MELYTYFLPHRPGHKKPSPNLVSDVCSRENDPRHGTNLKKQTLDFSSCRSVMVGGARDAGVFYWAGGTIPIGVYT